MQLSAKMACEIERAGFTEVLVSGIDIRCISTSVRPIANPPNLPFCEFLLSVTPSITMRNTKVSTASTTKAPSAEIWKYPAAPANASP